MKAYVSDTLKFAVVIFLDLPQEEVKEPAISVLGLFPNESSAESYCKHVGSHQYPLCDLYIIDTDKWVSPYVMDKEQMKEIYRNSRLDEIMLNRKNEQKLCANLEQKNNATVTVIDT